MRLSTQSKFTILFVAALGMLALATGYHTTVSVNATLSHLIADGSQNAVNLSANNVRDRYQELFNLKLGHALQVQRMLSLYERIITDLSREGLEIHHALSAIALPDGMTLWILDEDLRQVLVRGDMPPAFNPYQTTDIKGREVGRNSLRLSRAKIPASALVQFHDAAKGIRRYFGQHFYLPDQRLMVGLWTDLEPYEKAQRENRERAIESMQENFQRIRIGRTGFLFVADAGGAVVIRPEEWDMDAALATANPENGKTLIEEIRDAAARPDRTAYAGLPLPGGGRRDAIIQVSYFKPYGWYVAGVSFVDEIRAPGRELSLSLLGVILASTCGLVLVAMVLISRMTRPLTKLTRYARQLPQTDFMADNGADNGEALRALTVNRHGDEIEELSQAFLFMDGELRSRVRELVESTGSRERMAGELQAATGIQMGFLPGPISGDQAQGRFSLAASLTPAREVGGDLYDYFLTDDGRVFLVIGDVSDKGVPAALFMSMAMVLLRASFSDAIGPADTLDRVNRNLARENSNNMFVSLFIASVDLGSGVMVYANAGHNPPIVRAADGTLRRLDANPGLIAGAFDAVEYKETVDTLGPGDTLFLYTDGLTEAMNIKGELFGEGAMEAVLSRAGSDPEAVLAAMRQAVEQHVAGAAASDDLTMLCLHRTGGTFTERKNP